MRIIISLILFTFYSASTEIIAQTIDKKLHKQMLNAAKDFHGEIGWYIADIRRDKGSFYNADTIFPTASIVKVPILVGIMHKIEEGSLQYHQKLIYKDSLLYEGEDILGSFKNNEPIDLSKVIMLMLTTSDNTASLWLQSLAGTGTAINEQLELLGLQNTRVNSRTTGREENRTTYGWGQTTAREMAALFKKIVAGEVISKTCSNKMLKLLSRNYWDEEALSVLPAGVFVASKNGAVNASRSEALYVNAKRPYLFMVFSKNNKDTSWDKQNEAWVLVRKMSALAFEHYNK